MRPRSLPASDFAIGTIPPPIQTRTRPRVLAFLRSWAPAPDVVSALRQRLGDAELVVLTDHGVWSLCGDDLAYTDRLTGDVETAAVVTRMRDGTVVMIDEEGRVRRAQPEATLDGAIDALVSTASVKAPCEVGYAP